jgi:hypothetical protein
LTLTATSSVNGTVTTTLTYTPTGFWSSASCMVFGASYSQTFAIRCLSKCTTYGSDVFLNNNCTPRFAGTGLAQAWWGYVGYFGRPTPAQGCGHSTATNGGLFLISATCSPLNVVIRGSVTMGGTVPYNETMTYTITP